MAPSPSFLLKIIDQAHSQYAEARFHSRKFNEVRIGNGELEEARFTTLSGVGIRVLIDGAWGFSSSSSLDEENLLRSLKDASSIAKISSRGVANKILKLGDANLAKGKFTSSSGDSLDSHSTEEKVTLVREIEKLARSKSPVVKSAICSYREIIDEKIIVTSDGAAAELYDMKPEFRITAIASERGEVVSASESSGVTGGWKRLFEKRSPEAMAERAADIASRLIGASQPKGERATVILDPAMVGLISHEAIGHTVEADFVLSGSVVKDKMGEKVASELVTLLDSGPGSIKPGAGGTILVDDEGVIAQETVVIDSGVLSSYLHNRETAALFDVESTGNARAFEYTDEPLIRMRNTYIKPGDYRHDEMVKEVHHGYLLKGALGGQADANGEFMFGAQEAYLIENGEIGNLLRGVTISGQAFDTLSSVDAVGKDFGFEIGSGYCGKWQMAKVDGGGPHLRCETIVGGVTPS